MSNDRFKFRAWHKPTKRLFEVWGFTPNCVYENTVNGIYTSPTNPAKIEDCVLEQCTGIQDKNRKFIYEGDIVRVKTRHGTIVSSICYFDDFSMFAVKEVALYYRQYPTNRPLGSSGSSTSYRPYNWNSYFSVDVIGNIHENPELLEAGKYEKNCSD